MMLRYTPLLLALAIASPTAHAQAVFRSVMPDGKIVYGDKPAPGAKESKKVSLPPPNIAAPTQRPAVPADPNAPAGDAGNIEATAARQNLEAAKKALEAGREPLPGERTGIVSKGGAAHSQLNDAYQQRIKSLEDAVTAAQNQLDSTQRGVAR